MTLKADKSDTAHTHRVEITTERADCIRSNMDKPVSDLQTETGLTEYAIQVIKEAKRNDYWKPGTGRPTKFERLTDEMRKYFLSTKFETWVELRGKFNHHFRMSTLTPMGNVTIKKYYLKLKAN